MDIEHIELNPSPASSVVSDVSSKSVKRIHRKSDSTEEEDNDVDEVNIYASPVAHRTRSRSDRSSF